MKVEDIKHVTYVHLDGNPEFKALVVMALDEAGYELIDPLERQVLCSDEILANGKWWEKLIDLSFIRSDFRSLYIIRRPKVAHSTTIQTVEHRSEGDRMMEFFFGKGSS